MDYISFDTSGASQKKAAIHLSLFSGQVYQVYRWVT
jgi:hypothetical protein